jgi:hypothetical protein
MMRLFIALPTVLSLATCSKPDIGSGTRQVRVSNSTPSGGLAITVQKQIRSDPEIILDAVIHDVLTNPLLQDSRDFYGTPGDKRIGLSTKSAASWPTAYAPLVPGYEVQYLDPDRERDWNAPRLLGIALHHFAFPPPAEQPKGDLYDGRPIAIGILNIGGIGNNGPNGGGCLVYYSIKRKEGSWAVLYEGHFDP